MIKKISVIALGALSALALSASSVFAAATIKPAGVYYVEGNLGYGKVNEEVDMTYRGIVIEKLDGENTGFGWNISGGYKFNPNLSAEVGYTRFPDETYKSKLLGIKAMEGKNYAVDVAAKFIAPSPSGFNFFGKLGAAYVNHDLESNTPKLHDIKESGLAFYVGLGAGYAINQNIEVIAQATATTKVSDRIPPMYLGSIGLAYTF